MRRPARAGLVAALLLAACGKNNLAQTQAHLLVTPSALAFGAQPQHVPARLPLLLENGGQAALLFGAPTIDGPQAAMFSLGATLPAQLMGGASLSLPVIFTPTSAGAASATLHLASNDASAAVLDVPLSGAGAELGGLSVTPSSLAFGRVGEGEAQVLPLTLDSLGPADLYLASLAIAPAQMGFALVGATTTPATLGAGQRAQLAIRYAPLPGAEATAASLTITSSDPDHPTLQVPLTAAVNQAPIPVVTGQVPPGTPLATSMTAQIGATVILDGSASSDPDGDLPLTFAWTLAARPEGSQATLPGPTSPSTQLALDVAGVYSIQLVVTDSAGLKSLAPATLQIQALPPVQLSIELSWDQLRPDLDLHLLQDPGAPMGSTSDCGWTNPDPAWFPGGPDHNPRFQGDQLVGYGPEIIDWKSPQAGSFPIAVVFTDANGLVPPSTNARVRVFAFGVLVAELTTLLTTPGQVWSAGVIDWPSGRVTATSTDGGTGQ